MTRRFAPSTTGPAHPGTLLSGLLCWLDARASDEPILLRLEDIDPERCHERHAQAMVEDLAWLGLEFDTVIRQRSLAAQHGRALDHLQAAGRLYPCGLSRRELALAGRRSRDGGWYYDNRNRGQPLPGASWRDCSGVVLRARIDDGPVAPIDLGGIDLGQDPAGENGDPVVRRRDGAVTYQLAVVVDDAGSGVDVVIRGRDLAPATATQVALARVLGLPVPSYRHHLLLLESRDRKWSKLHGAIGLPELRAHYDPAGLCGFLAHAAGLRPGPEPCTPQELLRGFSWSQVATRDRGVAWEGGRLQIFDPGTDTGAQPGGGQEAPETRPGSRP